MRFEDERDFAQWVTANGPEYTGYDEKYVAIDDCVGDVYGVALYVASTEFEDYELDHVGSYYFAGMFSGEYWGSSIYEVDGGKLVFFNTDFTKSRHDDWAWYLEDTFWDYLRNGSEPRKTNRTGPIGSKAIEGFGDTPFWVAFEG